MNNMREHFGNFVKFKIYEEDSGDWGIVTYLYGDDGEYMVSVIGLGKSDAFPVPVVNIIDIDNSESALHSFMKGRDLLWLDDKGRIFYTLHLSNNAYTKCRIIQDIDKCEFVNSVSLGFCYQLQGYTLLKDVTNMNRDEHGQNYKPIYDYVESIRKDNRDKFFTKKSYFVNNIKSNNFEGDIFYNDEIYYDII